MAAPSPSRSTSTPSRRYDNGVGSETDGQWEEFATASAGQSSAYVSTVISVKSTKQMMECSGRGTCNPFGKNNGECMCYPGYGPSSDGQGGLPDDDWNIRDCGSMRTDFNWTGITCPYVAPQWGGSQSICGSKHTACNAQKQCNCSYGYEGGACEWLTCSRGKAW